MARVYCFTNSNFPQNSALADGCLYTNIYIHIYIYILPTHLRARAAVYVICVSLNSLYIHDECNFGDVLFHFRNVAVSCDGLLNVCYRHRMRQI